MPLSRRGLIGAGGLALGGLFLPRPLTAAVTGAQRRFVFVFCPGGWDPAMVFAPVFSSTIDRDYGDAPASTGGIPYVDSESRPSVRRFFETWAARTCVVNGWNVPSVAHEVCTRLTMTGTVTASQDDWVSIVANGAGPEVPMPNVLLDGPLFPNLYPTASVRLGTNGQLSALLTGEASSRSTLRVAAPSSSSQALSDDALRRRLDRYTQRHLVGTGATVAAATRIALDRADVLRGYADQLEYVSDDALTAGVATVLSCFELGLARTATLAYGTGGNGAWDTHSDNRIQDTLFEELFAALCDLCDGLDAAPGTQGGTLLDETCIVVLSEMGRTPLYNSAAGKDHWPYTSALFIGSGVKGGQAIGEYADDLTGQPIDVASGAATAAGEVMYPGHLGATILALADIDPGPWVPEGSGRVLEAVLE